ncbi:uncharacterized protein LOC122311776 isoform X1 [Carya illinoinensis]|uniref:RING-CH-type domain-containing protein n=1 Tax=Carya illinoinensis TaxID=32201 RepID=A0A8T1QNU4_CARIL|nr:uncharacterized protein LOC122311776 isoform X1 [Carya illinoinensis]XP_042982378.1 uncharacterized protein LOC122311776 isoform X1 [Carya illinoinensis]XP_042982379.1 uncharacterized protein LOC122311776 isoform X1 [Carya illinoinensis]XP_042982380.1 uncharacterized protein LOC122311776 isoform X1 [Carya illinoinensis]XP_042982381.1 uncharacterized protein LOC122311776 isoform X1 [Carya illinoinensis]KAG6655883.1 hypothetical protein CIPAW_05G247200 [Carya illinoinensis]KAG6655884.1 hypot
MGDHFVLLVDRLLTESTLEATIQSSKRSMQATSSAIDDKKTDDNAAQKVDNRNMSSSSKLVECRICQDEDEDSNMETPCSCCGSLKYAHRRCIQRWCNEKGDTICEICHQQFKPDYTAPPPLFQFGRVPMNFRGNWEIPRRDLHNPHIIAMVSSNRNFINPDYDEHSSPTARSLICCRFVALTFMVLLILRHTLPIIISGNNEYSFSLSMLLLFRTAGLVLPIYIMVRAVSTSLQRRRLHQPSTSSDEVIELSTLQPQPQPHIIRIHV